MPTEAGLAGEELRGAPNREDIIPAEQASPALLYHQLLGYWDYKFRLIRSRHERQ